MINLKGLKDRWLAKNGRLEEQEQLTPGLGNDDRCYEASRLLDREMSGLFLKVRDCPVDRTRLGDCPDPEVTCEQREAIVDRMVSTFEWAISVGCPERFSVVAEDWINRANATLNLCSH